MVTSTFRDVAALAAFDDDHASREEVWAMLAMLPPRQRAVLVLRYFEDLDDRRIAELVGSSAGAVRVHAHRGLTALRETLAQRADQAPSGAGLPATVRSGVVRATRRRRIVAAGGIAVVAALVVLALIPLLRPASGPAPAQPSPSATTSSSAQPATTLALTPLTLTPPVFPYTFGNAPAETEPRFVGLVAGLANVSYGAGYFEGHPAIFRVDMSRTSMMSGPPPEEAVASQTTVNGTPATLRLTPGGLGGAPFVGLEWQRDGLYFLASSDGTYSADQVRAMAESMSPGTTVGTRAGNVGRIASIAVPSGYEMALWDPSAVCAGKDNARLCVSVLDANYVMPTGRALNVDGLTAAVHLGGDGQVLEVRQADGIVVQLTYTYVASDADLIAIYHGISLLPA